MSAAVFLLAINLFVAAIFATAFGVVAAYARTAFGARWLSVGYGIGMMGPVAELMLPNQIDPKPLQVMIFMSFLVAVSLAIVGMARHYRLVPPWRLLAVLLVLSLVDIIVIVGMPRDSALRSVLYQLPYFAIYGLGMVTILRHGRRQMLDQALAVLFALSALHFLVKPLLAQAMGTGASARVYIASNYAAFSQSISGMLMLAIGILLLLVIVRDTMAEITERSETDKLSGLLNRRGFEDRADRLIASTRRMGLPGAMIVADLDLFKTINDSLGHEAGDRVIAAFAAILVKTAGTRSVMGRMGGEEFVVFIPGADLPTARLYAETVRTSFGGMAIDDLDLPQRLSASFGVAPLMPADSLSDLLRRADAALYEAKETGRDKVCVARADGGQRFHAAALGAAAQ